jgi:DNA-binding NarL/FixJ family response regulator
MSVRLVIAEDTEHIRRMLVDILGLHGFDVVAEARTGDEALRRVDENVPDVVVVGHSRHGLDGVEATRRIRDHGPHPQVILYAAIDSETEDRAKDAGAVTCVSRTAGVEALAREITAITFCVERSRAPFAGASGSDARELRRGAERSHARSEAVRLP